ncbi:hypothetical protein PHLGIDRAFT_11799 [Phlebiopsis gigantea 11061_1 CR5-6]|uniref:Uncharacterized protein n=1 Tax=Phlebiopsis gigantea (strain 11061_1 CR5-6) TaxID=745531 RepID=A0A0C3SDG9_PHLG1|nr:hypothetical protein PHLGIDRAFT_11799 [Phlebiopsis gigantea 11061_1 CR5-6]
MAKLTAILAVISLAVAGVLATSDKPGGFNVMPQDLMACGSSSRTRLDIPQDNSTAGNVDPHAVDVATLSTSAEAPAYTTPGTCLAAGGQCASVNGYCYNNFDPINACISCQCGRGFL